MINKTGETLKRKIVISIIIAILNQHLTRNLFPPFSYFSLVVKSITAQNDYNSDSFYSSYAENVLQLVQILLVIHLSSINFET